MTIEARLRRLERAAKPPARNRRCATCKDWPATLIRYPEEPPGHVSRRPPAPPNDGSPPTTPCLGQRCPNCGWQPTTIAVEYVDDWRQSLPHSGRP